MPVKTADLCDAYAAELRVFEPLFSNFGGLPQFHGRAVTLKVFEDNTLVRAALEQPGQGQVLVVDGGGSLRCALVGDQLAVLGLHNGWAGLIVHGCVRDCAALAELELGIQALASHPLRSVKRNEGTAGIPVQMAGVWVSPGDMVYADDDGIVVASRALVEA